jgi:hypothetical protein
MADKTTYGEGVILAPGDLGDDMSEEIAEEEDLPRDPATGVVLAPGDLGDDLSEEIVEDDDDPVVLPSWMSRR